MLRTKEQRRRDGQRLQKEKIKSILIDKEKENDKRYYLPPLLKTFSNRLKRIDPWTGVSSMNHFDCTAITYYRLRQYGISNISIAVTGEHSWNEIFYNDEWWVFDPKIVTVTNGGEPIKRQSFLSKPIEKPLDTFERAKLQTLNSIPKLNRPSKIEHPIYNELKRYYSNIDDYYKTFEFKISYTKDEAQIAAMKDHGLSLVFRSHT